MDCQRYDPSEQDDMNYGSVGRAIADDVLIGTLANYIDLKHVPEIKYDLARYLEGVDSSFDDFLDDNMGLRAGRKYGTTPIRTDCRKRLKYFLGVLKRVEGGLDNQDAPSCYSQ